MESSPTSAAELLRSGHMSNSVLLLQHEATAQPPFPLLSVGHSSNGDDDDNSKQSQIMENAARVALLITRSYVNALSTSQEDLMHHLPLLQLNDFYIYLDDDSSTAAPNNERLQTLCVLGCEITPPTRSTSPINRQERMNNLNPTSKQILGKLLYFTFHLGESPPSIFFIAAKSATENNHARSSCKSFRASEVSLFSRLIESNALPLSICRLLSDLIDTGPVGKAVSPFESVDDVIEALEQMISYPQIFLHNSNYPQGVPQPPTFGQVYHGRKEELATAFNIAVQVEKSTHGTDDESPTSGNLELIFVSGSAGSGKSHLVHTVEDHLKSSGWIVIKAKFERSTVHASRGILLSMFDQVISHLVVMKDGGRPSDLDYIERVSKSIMDTIGNEGLTRMVGFLPSIPLLFDGINRRRSTSPEAGIQKNLEDAENSNRQLIHSLIKILEAVLEPDRFIMLCCDDLQWADSTSLSLITEVLIKVGSLKQISRHCLFVGLFREEEVNEEHPFSIQYSHLQMSTNINTSKIKLSGLSKDDVVDMLMHEFRLPRRVVVELAELVHKKTTGHAYFVIELLNSLIADLIVAYSSVKCRYAWDLVTIELIQTGDNVAELIASNFSSLPPESQRMLHILSCFGIQTDVALLQIVNIFQQGIIPSIDNFVDRGILDRAGPIVIFTHDLIQQAIYESMALEQRMALHHDLGLFLGTASWRDASLPLTMRKLKLNDQDYHAGRSLTSPLIAITCDQLNLAGPEAASGENQRLKFAEWNLSAGNKLTRRTNFRAAQYYFSNGVKFLGDQCWIVDPQLCLELHEGAILASFALNEFDNVEKYTQQVIRHAAFDDSILAQQYFLRSLTASGQQDECISKGIELLRQLGVEIPLSPTRESVMSSMISTNVMASNYSADQIINLCDQALDESVHGIVKIMEAFFGSCYSMSSPFLPLITCEIVKYSLQFGVCPESTTAFASFAVLKVALEENYSAGRYWATIVRALLRKHNATKSLTAHFILYVAIDIWFSHPREISSDLLEYHRDATKVGELDFALLSLDFSWRYKLLGGEKLSVILKSFCDRQKKIAKHANQNEKKSKKSLKPYSILDGILLVALTGKNDEIASLLCDINDVEAEAEAMKGNSRLLYHVHVYNTMLGFWRGDYMFAEKSSHNAMASPYARRPELLVIYHTLFRALVVFQLYRKDSNDKRLKEGREMMDKMRKWTHNSMAVFQNKWLLLKAEYTASFQGSDDASRIYEASIKAARDNGNIHELGLAYNLFGDYHAAHGRKADSNDCYIQAYVYYTQWGATAVAERLLRKHNLDVGSAAANNTGSLQRNDSKHHREWD